MFQWLLLDIEDLTDRPRYDPALSNVLRDARVALHGVCLARHSLALLCFLSLFF